MSLHPIFFPLFCRLNSEWNRPIHRSQLIWWWKSWWIHTSCLNAFPKIGFLCEYDTYWLKHIDRFRKISTSFQFVLIRINLLIRSQNVSSERLSIQRFFCLLTATERCYHVRVHMIQMHDLGGIASFWCFLSFPQKFLDLDLWVRNGINCISVCSLRFAPLRLYTQIFFSLDQLKYSFDRTHKLQIYVRPSAISAAFHDRTSDTDSTWDKLQINRNWNELLNQIVNLYYYIL